MRRTAVGTEAIGKAPTSGLGITKGVDIRSRSQVRLRNMDGDVQDPKSKESLFNSLPSSDRQPERMYQSNGRNRS